MKLVWLTDNRDPVAVSAAHHLLGRGWRVALNDLGGENVDGCERTKVDLKDFDSVSAAIEGFGGALLGVVHSAPPPVRVSVEAAREDQWASAFDGGALSAMQVTRAACEHLSKLGRGAMVYLGSIHAEKPMGCGFLHSMGCAATQMLCREAALSYGGKGVHCIYIQRGVLAFDMENRSDITNVYSGAPSRYPKKRFPKPGSLCGLIEFALSEAAQTLNGSDLRADEGYVMFYGNQLEGDSP